MADNRPRDKYNVLVIEDDLTTIGGTLNRLSHSNGNYPVKYVYCTDVAKVGMASTTKFDLVLVDLELPDDGVLNRTAGAEFVTALRAGEFGGTNQETPAVILTSWVNDPSLLPVLRLVPPVHVIGKGGPAALHDLLLALEKSAPWLELGMEFQNGDSIREDLVSIRPRDMDTVAIYVGSWPGEGDIIMKTRDLPSAMQQELAFGVREIWAWALVDVSAEVGEHVRPHNFTLISRPAKSEFEREQPGEVKL